MRLKLLAFVLSVVATSGFGRNLTLDMDDQQFQGNSTIHLRQELRDQFNFSPGQLDDMKLEKVTLIAKSRHGNGHASLRVGQRESGSKLIRGSNNFNSDNINTYDRDTFDNPNRNDNSNGVWQILLRGNIKVKRIIVQVDDDHGGGNVGDDLVLTFNNEQFQGNSTIHLRQEIRNQLGFTANDLNDVKVQRVYLYAKSRQGNGSAALKMGNRTTRYEDVDGRPNDFNDSDLDSYDRIRFDNPNNNDHSNGVWQILLRGNIKVKRIVLHVDD